MQVVLLCSLIHDSFVNVLMHLKLRLCLKAFLVSNSDVEESSRETNLSFPRLNSDKLFSSMLK